MEFKWIILILIILIPIIGFFYIRVQLDTLNKNLQFSEEFLGKFDKFIQSKGMDDFSYEWLLRNSGRMQKKLGLIGIAVQYKPPFANYYYTNYQIIINTLPLLRQSIDASSSLAYDYYMSIWETLQRFIGEINEEKEIIIKKIKNPLILFFTGVSYILSFPIRVLQWVGIISSSVVTDVEKTSIFKFLALLISLIGLIASILEIIDGWDRITQFFPNL